MPSPPPLRKPLVGLVPLGGIAAAAYLSARGIAALAGSALTSGTAELAAASASAEATPDEAARGVISGAPILERNPFDHETGPLAPPRSEPPASRSPSAPAPRPSTRRAAVAESAAPAAEAAPPPFPLARAEVDRLLENQAELVRLARVAPVRENGRIVGVRLVGISPLLASIGVQIGDRVRSVNGFDVSTPDNALAAYAHLKTTDRLSVHLERNGRPVFLDYRIR